MKHNVGKMLFIITLTLCVNVVYSLNILGIFPAPVKSHFYVFEPYLQELSARGHNVTVISLFAEKKPQDNYHVIDLSENTKVPYLDIPIRTSRIISFLEISALHVMAGPYSCRILLSDENVQKLWTKQQKFDVIVLEQYDSDCSLGLAYKLGAPVVGLTSHTLLPWHYSRLGVPYNPSYVLFDFFEGGSKPSLLQRLQRTICYSWYYFLNKYVTQRIEQSIVEEYLGEIPSLEELGSNIKFLLLYQNFVLSGSSLLPANIKEVGGYHVKKPKPLPDELNKFIEESKHGVIYFSFGSNIKSSALSTSTLEEIVAAFSEFPQRVVWKWEKSTLPGNPKNIYVSKWLPQNDILAHPKVLAFFTHCGLLGMTEAIHHGVPILGMPVFGDQPTNAAAAEEAGLGVQIRLHELTKENIVKKLKIILNPEFKKRVKLLSEAWRDRPVSAMDSAIFWTEYAARHNVTYKSHSATVPLHQYLCLDIIAILFLIFLIFGLCMKICISLCCKIRKRAIKNKKE